MNDKAAKCAYEKPFGYWDSHTLWCEPEFVAFCRLLGIPWEQGMRDLVLRIPFEGIVQVECTFLCAHEAEIVSRGASGDKILADSTTQHNRRFRTVQPIKTGEPNKPSE